MREVNRVSSTNDQEAGTAAVRGGYDVFFSGLTETEETPARNWQATAGGRSPEAAESTAPPPDPAVAGTPAPPSPSNPDTHAAPNGQAAVSEWGLPQGQPGPAAPNGQATVNGHTTVNGQAASIGQAPANRQAMPNGQASAAGPQSVSAQAGSATAYYQPAAQFSAAQPTGQFSTVNHAAAPAWQIGSPDAPAQAGALPAPAAVNSTVPPAQQQTGAPAWGGGEMVRQGAEQVEVLPIALTSTELLAELAATRQAQLRSTVGMRGALNKVGFNLGLSPLEQRTELRRARIRRQLTSSYQIAVINVKGGVGRTTTVAALGSTFSELRPDRVVAIDANPDFGDLPSRTGRHPYGLSLRDLAQATQVEAFSAVQSFTSINNADLAVIASPWTSAATEALSGQEYLRAVEILRLHYNLLLIDCGTGVLDSATGTVLQTSDAVVVVTPATVRGVTGAVATLEWMNTHGLHRLVARTVVAIVYQHPAKPEVEIGRIEELFEAAQRPTRVLPYDPHLAEGGEIDLRLLSKDTALAFEELAADLADAFPSSPVPVRGDRGGWR